jgi:AcrR family transcriptional regulator
MQELAEVGFPAVRFESVARRAGVNKTTLYRRWTTPEALLLEAALEFSADTVSVPDTGSLRDDLFFLAQQVAENLRSPAPQAMVRAVVTQVNRSSELVAAARSYWRKRVALMGAVVQRAIERGEISFSADPGLLIEALIGPMYLRTLVTQEPVDGKWLEELVDLTVASASPGRQ